MMNICSDDLKNKRVIIVPFNTEALFLYHRLITDGIQVVGFMDKNLSLKNMSYDDKPIFPYMYFPDDDIVIVIANTGFVSQDKIIESIRELGDGDKYYVILQDNVETVSSNKEIADKIDIQQLRKFEGRGFMEVLKEKLCDYTVENPLKLSPLNIVLTTKCTRKCEGCCHLMDYFHPEDQADMNLPKTIECLDVMMKHVDYVGALVPIGGETFAFRELDKLFLHIINKGYDKRIGYIHLVTNGTIVPSNELLRILGTYPELFLVTVTDYGFNNRNKITLIEKLNSYGCNYENFELDDWELSNQPVTQIDNPTEEEIRNKCKKCLWRYGKKLQIVENRIYNCHFVIYAERCHVIPKDSRNYLDIYRDSIDKTIINDFNDCIVPGMAYCSGRQIDESGKGKPIPKAVQTKTIKECKRYL